jgi:N-acetylneuraminic acid mutarotase
MILATILSSLLAAAVWQRLPDMPQAKEQLGFEAMGDHLYAVGGVCDGNETNTGFTYDLLAGSWEPVAPMSLAIQSPCLRAVGGRLFLIGGYDHRIKVKYSQCLEYDAASDQWLERSPMPSGREDMGSAVVGDEIWIFGGVTNPEHEILSDIVVYNSSMDFWAGPYLMPEPWALGDPAAPAGETVYLLAGTNTMFGYPSLQPARYGWAFNSQDRSWSLVEGIPTPRCYAECELIGSCIYVVGGVSASTTDWFSTMDILDIRTTTWRPSKPLPYAARGMGVASARGELYIAGGYNGRALARCYVYLPDDDSAVEALSSDPGSADGSAVVFIDTIGPTPDDDPPPAPSPKPVPGR